MIESLRVYWSRVERERAHPPSGAALLAVWPAPVNADACFEAAGFTEFADADEAWDRAAESLVERLVGELSAFGAPSLRTPPIRPERSWRDRALGRGASPPPLTEQILAPMHWDTLPDAVVDFGGDVSLRAGSGHFLLWITLPAGEVEGFVEGMLPRAAAGHPLARRDLAWEHLLPSRDPRSHTETQRHGENTIMGDGVA